MECDGVAPTAVHTWYCEQWVAGVVLRPKSGAVVDDDFEVADVLGNASFGCGGHGDGFVYV